MEVRVSLGNGLIFFLSGLHWQEDMVFSLNLVIKKMK